jgi:predicted metal-dependent peptidase
MKTAEERITQSRVRLLLNKPFFGQLATRLRLEDASDYIPTAATDGRRFLFNRAFVDSLTDAELDFLVGHEVLHCVFDHMEARGDRHPRLYNAAADFNINMTLMKQSVGDPIGEDKLGGGKMCLDWKYDGWNSYEIYDDLYKNAKDAEGMDVHLEISDGEAGDEEGKGYSVQMSEEEKKALADEIKQATIQAAQAAGQDVPDSIKRMINELVAPKMDWRDVLRTNMESSLKSDFTWMRPSKRSGEVIFPGMNKDEVLKAFIALDLSGSISHELAKEMLSEVQGIMEQYADYEIHVCCFDTKIYNYDVFTSEDGRSIMEYETMGGGGTDFDVVFKFLEEEAIEPDQLVMFTDGYPWGSWGNADYCDTLFVIHGDPKGRIQAPFGVTVHYDQASVH